MRHSSRGDAHVHDQESPFLGEVGVQRGGLRAESCRSAVPASLARRMGAVGTGSGAAGLNSGSSPHWLGGLGHIASLL